MNDRGMLLRCSLMGFLMLTVSTGLGVRLATLHLGSHEGRLEQIERMHRFRQDLLGRRGTILDGSGSSSLLALDRAADHVVADPQVILEADALQPTAMRLAELLDMDADSLAERLYQPGRRYARIQMFVPREVSRRVTEENLTGVFMRPAHLRYYPHGSLACHVLGFVNHEGVGSAGIEQRYDRYLRGRHGVIQGRLDALRREIYTERTLADPGEPGHTIELTIDQHIQLVVERELDALMESSQSEAAWAIVQDVRTGEILAMASRPAYDLNDFRSSTEDQRLNRAIGMNFEPGSSLKPAAFAAALNEGIVTPDTVFHAEHGSWVYKGRPLRDVSAQGELTVTEGLQRSSNILTAKMSLMLGNDRLYQYFRDFGLGEPLGIDLPGEEAGIFHPPERWYGISPTRIPIGQGIATTALQLLTVQSTIANDGYRMRPYVVRRIVSEDGNVVMENEPSVVARAIRSDTAETMRELLYLSTQDFGTGRRATFEGMKVAGKTGTAQKPGPGGYSSTDFIASFAGFFPADDPAIAMVIVADTPRPVTGGGRVAAPVFASIGEEISRYLGLYRDENASDMRMVHGGGR